MVHLVCLSPYDPENNFLYCPSFPAADLFTALFLLSTLLHIYQAFFSTHRKHFCWILIMGGAWELIGLTSRIAAIVNITSQNPAIVSVLFILLAPLWVNAFLYVVLSRFVWYFVPERQVAGVRAERLASIFVGLDILSFFIQAIGGIMISQTSATTKTRGIHIYMAGIGIQECFILGFVYLVVRFHKRMAQLEREGPVELKVDGAANSRLRPRGSWRRPLYVLYASLVCITIRIIFRLVEFSLGFISTITLTEAPFYTLEMLPMICAFTLWNVWHPGKALVGPESEFPSRKERKAMKERETAAGSEMTVA
uniref:RTA1-domain-containing protein n=1 Tax=Mycena chlorophos TaxID=658473 RepID=A0ABQ0LHX6_MYCCL|nr:predicted protein [Mycena chlorophos]